MSEVVQKPKFISFKEFLPQWTEVVKEMDEKEIGKEYKDKINFKKEIRDQPAFGALGNIRIAYSKERGLNFMNGGCCLVGEGHKGDSSYASSHSSKLCFTCREMSYGDAFVAMNIGGEHFNDFKHALYNHTMLEHPSLLVKQ